MPLKQGDITIGICVLILLYITYKLIMLCCNCNELGPNSMLSSDYSFIDHFIPSNVSGQQLRTSDGNFSLIIQSDGNLVLYNNIVVGPYTTENTVIWQSNTSNISNTVAPYRLKMRSTGELVILDSANTVTWTTGVPVGTITNPSTQINVTSSNVAYVSVVDTGNNNKVLWISDCTQQTTGPFTSNCVQQWWKADYYDPVLEAALPGTGCTVDLTQNNNGLLSNYMNTTDASSIIKTKMDAYKKSKSEANTQVCYGKSLFDKFNISSLNSSQQLSSVSPKQYIAQNYAIPAGTAESTVIVSPTRDTLTNCMYKCNNDSTCTGIVRSKNSNPSDLENCWFKTANTSSNIVNNDATNHTWTKF